MRTDDEWRHQCEVQSCIKRFYPNRNAMALHMHKITAHRGFEAARKLAADIWQEWKKMEDGR